MGNSQFQIPERVRREWSESFVNDKRLFQNKLTQESFYFLVFTQLEPKSTFPELIQRSIYPIPKTPKIIILNDKQGQISFLVQRKIHSLKAILTALFLQLQLYQTIKEIISTIYKLYKRYGAFGITEDMIGGSNQKEIIVWINETYQQSWPSNKLTQSNFVEQAILLQLLQIIKSNIQSDLLNDMLVYAPSSFQQIISLLDQKIQKEKSTLYKRKDLQSNRKVPPLRYFSPRNTFNNNKKIIREEQTERNQENKRKYNIPNFIKGIKDKKSAFENQQKQKNKESHALLKKQKQFLNYSCKFLRKGNKADNLNNVSFSKLRTFNVSSPSNSKHHKNQKHYESGSTDFSSVSKNFSSQNYEKLTFSKKSNQQFIQKRNTHPTEKYFNPQTAKRYQHKQKCKQQFSQIDPDIDETLKKTTKNNVSRLSYGLNTLCRALHESQQLNDTVQIILSQKQSQLKGNQQYKVVVHDQLHYSMSFQQPTNMIEQFSRIIY